MVEAVVAVFVLVYVGMLLGKLPRLELDRTGVALLGAIALIAGGFLSLDQAARSIDLSTITLLFAFMVISAQLRLGGFYTRTAEAVTSLRASPGMLLAAVILLTGVLSAVFMNDIVCLALPPVVIQACRRRGLHPVPFLLAVACAANVGSAATLIGNPQNILIGQSLGLSFSGYLLMAAAPSVLGLLATWVIIAARYRRRWKNGDEPAGGLPADTPAWNPWQSSKALFITGVLVVVFLFTNLPRDITALGAAGLLLMSRRMHSRSMLGLVDWQLLVLFCGLFIVNHALALTHVPDLVVTRLTGLGVDPSHPGWLFVLTALLSDAVSNVPAVMLLLPVAHHPLAGPILALSSTFAGNLLIVGSIANIIVVESAAAHGIRIGWREHAPTGIAVTAVTLALAALTLWIWPLG
ncbi:MAG: anion transporter [Desulfomonilia bacterium]|jgi:Na+/H+ antiporter NhaD/arsenite permease-like protein